MVIVMAVDFSEVTSRMLDVVRGFPAREKPTVFVVHVGEPEPDFVGWKPGPETVRDQVAKTFQRQRGAVEALAAQLRAEGIEAAGLVVPGPTVATILDEVRRRNADLVCVGAHGHGAAYDLVVGSVSAGVIRGATVPVLVVPRRDA